MSSTPVSGNPKGFRRHCAPLLLIITLLLAGCGGAGGGGGSVGGGGGGGTSDRGGDDGSGGGNVSVSPGASVSTVDINSSPVAIGSCSTVQQGDPAPVMVGQLHASDSETPSMLTYSLLNPDGSDAGLTLTTARGGTVTITDQTTGAYTYQADSRPGDKRGRDSFEYQVSDPEDAVASATEVIIVNQTIMPLGDSITLGDRFSSYRKSLYTNLIDAGYTFDYVGSQEANPVEPEPLVDDEHEGHGGWSAFDIAWGQAMDGTDGVFSWLEQNPADFILLHIGTNGTGGTDKSTVAEILDEIDRWENSANGNPVTVILARIIDRAPVAQVVTTFNKSVASMVRSRTNDDIILVDQQYGAGIDYTIGVDMVDRLHPNASGYAKMASVWFDGLAPLLDKCP